MQQPGRGVGRRMVVARSNCSRMGVERRSNRSYNHRLTIDRRRIPPPASESATASDMRCKSSGNGVCVCVCVCVHTAAAESAD